MLILCRAHSILRICAQHTVILYFCLQHTAAHKKTSLPLQKSGPPVSYLPLLLPHSPLNKSAARRGFGRRSARRGRTLAASSEPQGRAAPPLLTLPARCAGLGA